MKGYKAETKTALVKSLPKVDKNVPISCKKDNKEKPKTTREKSLRYTRERPIRETRKSPTVTPKKNPVVTPKKRPKPTETTNKNLAGDVHIETEEDSDNNFDAITIATPEYDISITPYNTPSPPDKDGKLPCFEMQVSTNMPFTLKLYCHN